ncbi:MAG: Flagellar biosynthesis/type III secretory pathway protein FliH [Thermodesulfobacteria bacterium]|nr:FliH/SctL family protein [Thermodesulfobacteriota bacterium]MCU4137672.1 Flagellar biosynthesis/type III secretory pathway protein FliH [Thermodesulfobacteriota bacterium]
MSKILKNKQINNTSIIIPDPSPIKGEVFQSLFEINIEDISKLKKGIKSPEEKAKKEGFEIGYKEGLNKGYLEGHKRGYKEGFEKGKKEAEERYKKLENILKKDFQEKIRFINTFLKKLEKESKELILNMDKEVLNLALNIAQKLILKEIESDPEISLRLIKEALNYIAEGTELNIKVNPEEYKFLEENLLKYISPSQKIKLIPDESISKGGIFIETSLGVIDATFEKRWKKLLETLLKDEG